jgi:pimeloyl-ACP methyl ester carboxylesterase
MEYRSDMQADDVAAFVDPSASRKHFVLVGVSMGCLNALH